jgi:hypothetical protein
VALSPKPDAFHGVGHTGEQALLGGEISLAALTLQVHERLQVLFERVHVSRLLDNA